MDLPLIAPTILDSSLWTLRLEILSTLLVVWLAAVYTREQTQRVSSLRLDHISLLEVYSDDDGLATHASLQQYNNSITQSNLTLGPLAGLFSTTIHLLFTSSEVSKHNNSGLARLHVLLLLSWALVFLRAQCIYHEHAPRHRYALGIQSACACLFLFISSVGYHILVTHDTTSLKIFTLIPTLAALFSALKFVSFPRRPDIFTHDGIWVDRQKTVSASERYAFSWCEPILRRASEGNFGLKELPAVDNRTRSLRWHITFPPHLRSQTLWRQVILGNVWPLFKQWFLMVLQAGLQYTPRYAMYRLLESLEAGQLSVSPTFPSWLWAFMLGGGSLLNVLVDNRLYWVMWSEIVIPLRGQLSALIFHKAMKLNNVPELATSDTSPSYKSSKGKNSDTFPSIQETVNLICGDTYRISNFSAFSYILLGSMLKVLFATMFLLKLVGWQSLLGGLLVNLTFVPLNRHVAKQYKASQRKMMKIRDEKIGIVTEVFQSIRQIKIAAQEMQWQKKIHETRSKELDHQWCIFVADAVMTFSATSGSVLLAAVTIISHVTINRELKASVAFTVFGVFLQLQSALEMVPRLVTELFDASVSISRLQNFLNRQERNDTSVNGQSIQLKNACITWPTDNTSQPNHESRSPGILLDVNLQFPEGKLSVISGKTGSGKSLLLSALIGEAQIISGILTRPKELPDQEDPLNQGWLISTAMAFVSQTAWLKPGSIKANITFGLPFDDERYQKVIAACALEEDLATLPQGNETEVGARGASLSGGQRMRVSFARALYSRAGILVIDDIFSTLDSRIAAHVFTNGIVGELAEGRTRVLATHHLALCAAKASYFVSIEDRTVKSENGCADLANSVVSHLQDVESTNKNACCPVHSPTSEFVNANLSPDTRTKPNEGSNDEKVVTTPGSKFSFRIYKRYLEAGGGLKVWLGCFFLYSGERIFRLLRSWWLKLWTSKTHKIQMNDSKSFFRNISTTSLLWKQNKDVMYYISGYTIISIVLIGIVTLRLLYTARVSIQASKALFSETLFTLLHMPLRWYDIVPIGQTLNRLTNDFATIDGKLADNFSNVVKAVLHLVGVTAAAIFVSPFFILISVVLLYGSVTVAQSHIYAARKIKNLDAEAKPPILDHFRSAVQGLSTIRASGMTQRYEEIMSDRLDTSSSTYWHLLLLNRWMGTRISMIGSILETCTAIFVVKTKSIDASIAGFALAFSLEFTQAITGAIRRYANMELDMSATERVVEFIDLEIEPQKGISPPSDWPKSGQITFDAIDAAHGPGLPLALNGLSFNTGNEKLAVVGRSGTGKSSLVLTLFRMMDIRTGTITIDGINILDLRLQDLRRQIAMIPQDPVLFSGTVRFNLDPENKYSDDQLNAMLRRVGLFAFSSSSPSPSSSTSDYFSLSTVLSASGSNVSLGQRQLLCLARVLLSKPKILILDEATSALDGESGCRVQAVLDEHVGTTKGTLIHIAHRLSSIARYDRVLVLGEGGQILEMGTPMDLLVREENGVFRGLVEGSEDGERVKRIILEGENQNRKTEADKTY